MATTPAPTPKKLRAAYKGVDLTVTAGPGREKGLIPHGFGTFRPHFQAFGDIYNIKYRSELGG